MAKASKCAKVAVDLGVGVDTLIAFLEEKGVSAQGSLNPNSRLTGDMVELLMQQFAPDRDLREQSEQVSIGMRPEMELVSLTKDAPPPAEQPVHESVEQSDQVVERPPQHKEKPQETPAPASAPKVLLRRDSPVLRGPRVVGKIELEKLVSPKPGAVTPPRQTPPPVAGGRPSAAVGVSSVEEQTRTQELEPVQPPNQVVGASVPPPTITKTKYQKLEGVKVVGKIELTPEQLGSRERTKRNRFVVEKKSGQTPSSDRRTDRAGVKKQADRTTTIDEKTIRDKIQETQSRLKGRGGVFQAVRRERKKSKKEESVQQVHVDKDSVIRVSEFLSLHEFASLLNVSFTEVIAKCMNLGLMVSINQRLDAEVMELITEEYGYKIEFTEAERVDALQEEKDKEEDLLPCPPVVTIMGHVDHGKTSLIDYIRTANVVAGEAGGITQKIGAYEVTLADDKKITFLDTPGHEAFTAMRARGTKVADVAVVIIAADDAVMPQTKEAISHASAAGVPIVFAINKMDKAGANVDRVKEQLSQMDILVEDWGGKYQCQEISAKTGQNVDILLEKIILEAEVLNLRANPNKMASGTVLDSRLDKGRGYMTSILVQAGTLKVGDVVVCGQYFGRVKALFDERNHLIREVRPATPALLLGLNGNPPLGEHFRVCEKESEARAIATQRSQIRREQVLRTRKHITLDEIGRRLALGNFKELNIIIKADVDGTTEAISDALQQLSTDEVAVRVIHKSVGQIVESDVMLAAASDAIIIAFQVRPSPQATKLAQAESVEIKTYSVIYHVVDEIKSAMEGMLQPSIEQKVTANIEVTQIFQFDKNTVAGCKVAEGRVSRTNKIRVIREGVVLFTGEIASLKRYKDDVKEVAAGAECGLVIQDFNDVRVGDQIETFVEEETKRSL